MSTTLGTLRTVTDPERTCPADDHDGVRLPKVWAATDLAPPRRVEWLARQRIPRGAVTVLVGDEGIGKSLLWVVLAAALTTGHGMPGFGIPPGPPKRVVLALTEDDWGTTVRPRLDVVGADLDRIAVVCTERDGSGAAMFPRDLLLLAQAGPIDLVVVDALLDTLPSQLRVRDPQDARKALHPWREYATSSGAAVLLLTHTNRVESANPRDRYGITAELRKKARATLYAQADEGGQLVVGPDKSNLTGRVPASVFAIEPVQVFPASEDSDGTVPRLRWVGESDLSAAEHLAARVESAHDDDGDLSEGASWLRDYLTQHGCVPSQQAKQAARAAGISERTLKRAAKRLRVLTAQFGFPRTTTWELPTGPAGTSDPTGPAQDDHRGPSTG